MARTIPATRPETELPHEPYAPPVWSAPESESPKRRRRLLEEGPEPPRWSQEQLQGEDESISPDLFGAQGILWSVLAGGAIWALILGAIRLF